MLVWNGTLLQTTSIESTPSSLRQLKHQHPKRLVHTSPLESASNTSPYLTGATPSIGLIGNGNWPSAHTVAAPSIRLWKAVEVPLVTASSDSNMLTILSRRSCASKRPCTPSHTSLTEGVCAHTTMARPKLCSTTISMMLSQLSTSLPSARTPVMTSSTVSVKCSTTLATQCTVLYRLKSRKGYSRMSSGAVTTEQELMSR